MSGTGQLLQSDLCQCGCGSTVNPRVPLAREMRQTGMPFSKIGEALNCSGAYIKALLAKPPRFVKGHNGYVDYGFGECVSCGKRFAKKGPNQTVCNKSRTCASARQEANWAKWAEYNREVEERRVRREALVAQRREFRMLLSGKLPFGTRQFREQRLAEIEWEIENLTGELRALYDEQQKDERWTNFAGSRWVYSLDAPWRGEDDALVDYLQREDAIAAAFRSYAEGHAVTDGWTDVVHAIVDRRREIDEWADEVAA